MRTLCSLSILRILMLITIEAHPAGSDDADLQPELTSATQQVTESDPGGGWCFTLSLRDRSTGKRCLRLPSVLLGHQVRWEISGVHRVGLALEREAVVLGRAGEDRVVVPQRGVVVLGQTIDRRTTGAGQQRQTQEAETT